MNFSGESPVSVSYVGANGSKAVACATTFWFFGGACWQGVPVITDQDGSTDNWSSYKNGGENVDSKVIVKTWGEGKVLVIYRTDSAEGCAGIEKTYVGYETAYETYNLYELTGSQTDVNPANAQPVATLSIEDSSADLKLFADISAQTKDSSGNSCGWQISKDAALTFNLRN